MDDKISGLSEPCKDAKSDKFIKGGKAQGRTKTRGKSGRRFTKPEKPGNDFSYWNKYPELMTPAARYPWMHIAGTPLVGDNLNINLPNVAVQSYYPIPGVQDSATSSLNLAFRQLYLDMHRKYRGIGAYQASDIAITLLCVESALQKIVEAERIYGILNAYPIKSRIQPDGLLKAMGYNSTFINSVKSERANFRYEINRLINLAVRLPIPAGMSFFANHVGLNGFVYKDSEDDRADILVFTSSGFFEYETTGGTHCINNAGTAYLKNFARATFNSYTDLISDIEASLNTLMYDSDILRITSDLIACYGDSSMQVLQPLPEDYIVVPQYNEAILKKWHNSERILNVDSSTYLAYACPSSSTTHLTAAPYMFCVYQENDIVYSLPEVTGTTSQTWVSSTADGLYHLVSGTKPYSTVNDSVCHIVNTWEDEPSEETRCEAVLWKVDPKLVTISVGGSNEYCRKLTCFSTEVMSNLYIAKVSNSNLSGAAINSPHSWGQFVSNGALLMALSHFDWFPILINTGMPNTPFTEIVGDTDNVSSIAVDTMSKIVDAALLSAFKIDIKPTGSN